MEKLFKLKQNGTTVRTEVLAGLTTFMTMAYIIALNPNLIVGFGANAEVGGRTGLTSLVTGILFLLCMFISPIAALIPAPATSSALVFVGMLMMGSLKDVDYGDVAGVLPVVLMLVFMMVTSSVGNGIGIGLITYSVLKICTGKAKEVSWLTIVLAVLFILKFFIVF